MTSESVTWFVGQLSAGVLALLLGWRVARMPARWWKTSATIAAGAMLLWPLLRFRPADVLALLGARIVMFIEVTGIIIPGALLFSIAGRRVPRASDRRAIHLLMVICGLYFVQHGKWMVRPPVPDLGPTLFAKGVCLQSTDYTCVAASLVTLLNAHGIATSETEMAHLSHTERGNGATDSRGIRALERKLTGREHGIHYEVMSYERLCSVDMPCVVPVNWGYFASHMVPVLSANRQEVVIGDPLTGPRQCSAGEFRSMWKKRGIYLSAPPLRRAQNNALPPDADGAQSVGLSD